MIGLRTNEDERFIRFFAKVQEEAKKQNAVFFLDCGEGHDVFCDDIICTDCSGWLVPSEKADEFGKTYYSFGQEKDEWEDYVSWVTWSGDCHKPIINIELL